MIGLRTNLQGNKSNRNAGGGLVFCVRKKGPQLPQTSKEMMEWDSWRMKVKMKGRMNEGIVTGAIYEQLSSYGGHFPEIGNNCSGMLEFFLLEMRDSLDFRKVDFYHVKRAAAAKTRTTTI